LKLDLLLAAIGASTVTAAAVAGAATPNSTSQPPCVPKVGSSGGHVVVDYCGPATATLKIGSKTYDFKNGYCNTDTASHIVVALTLGAIESVKSPVNGGQSLFEMTDLHSSALAITTVTADVGGKTLDSVGTVKLAGSIPSAGTFTSTGFAKPSFSGSWNCHGVVVATP
jgi:hypothetical protein